jgi:Heterokaryon incompatibility protein (HET)
MDSYQPLTEPESQIRVVTLQSGQRHEPIDWALVIRALGSCECEALSYCWGDEVNLKEIELQNVLWQVTPNLHEALEELRSESTPRRMWIDALCINQKDVSEKIVRFTSWPKFIQRQCKLSHGLGQVFYAQTWRFGSLRLFQH